MKQRNSHWRGQNLAGHPQVIKNGSGPGSAFPGKLDENNIAVTPTMLAGTQSPVESDHVACKSIDHQSELANEGMPLPMSASVRSDGLVAHPLQRPVSEAQPADCPINSDVLNQQEELTIESGTINISSVYSQECVSSFQILVVSSRV